MMNSKNKAIIWQEKQHILFNLNTLLGCSANGIRLKPYAEKFLFYLDNLNSRHVFTRHLISDEPLEILQSKIKATGLDCLFDKIESSHSYGFSMGIQESQDAKEFWHKYLVNSKINANSAILFDENYNMLQHAIGSGLKVVAVNKLIEQVENQNQLTDITQVENFGALLHDYS